MLKNFKLRFNPDGECLFVAIDFIYYFFRKTRLKTTDIMKVTDIVSILKFMTNHKLEFIVSVPCLSALSPIYWYLKIKYGNISTIKFEKKKNELSNKKIKFVVLIQDTSKKIYGIKNENWSHFIVSFTDVDFNGIYDPLRLVIDGENYPEKTDMCNEIVNKALFKMLIWK